MKKLRFIYKYIVHFFSAKHTKGHHVHSPFIFNFCTYIIDEKHPFYIFPHIERLRKTLLHSTKTITVVDYGTGESKERKIKDIARYSLKQKKFAQLFFRIINGLKSKNVLELGTSLGITTAYLAASSKRIDCRTMEGCRTTAEIARNNFRKLNLYNINIVVGNIDTTLPDLLKSSGIYDFIFIDANHSYDALMRYFSSLLPHTDSNSIVIIDDIYWSKDMEKAWSEIKLQGEVSSTIDLFQVGIVFFNPDLHKKHYKMRY